jgi:hypothetical protein
MAKRDTDRTTQQDDLDTPDMNDDVRGGVGDDVRGIADDEDDESEEVEDLGEEEDDE